jgi:hypothetical protein
MRKKPSKNLPRQKKQPVAGNVRVIKKADIDHTAAQYATLEAMGFKPDSEGRVWCGKPKTPSGPCTTICFYPIAIGLKGKSVHKLSVNITSRSIEDTNRLLYFKALQPKKHSPTAPRLWDTKEVHINQDGKEEIRIITPTAAWPFHGRPSHEFLVIESIKATADSGDIHHELAGLKAHLADLVTASIVALDPSGLVKLAKCVEALKALEHAQPEAERASQRRKIVMSALQALAIEFRVPPTKQELRFRADKISAGMENDPLGAKKPTNSGRLGMDDKQFTRDLLNPLGLHWLPEASHDRR